MLIERTFSEVIIGLRACSDWLITFYKEATAHSKATQEQVDKLARQ